MGTKYVNALNMALLLLPGTPTTYYGEELGMTGVKVSYQQTMDPQVKFYGPVGFVENNVDAWSIQAILVLFSSCFIHVYFSFLYCGILILFQNRYTEFSRDPQRSPMQWSPDKNAGFSNGSTTWLPIHPDYKTVNVKVGWCEIIYVLNRLCLIQKYY